MKLPSSFRSSRVAQRAALLFAVAAGLSIGCSSADDSSSSEADITDVPHTPVKKQSIGNCWIYASLGWAESLHLRATGEALNLSESYLSYWHWYDQVVDSETAKLETGGWFHSATELMSHYALVAEADFIESEADAQNSSVQARALSRMNDALAAGEPSEQNPFKGLLATRAKRTPANVRKVLSDAFDLSPAVRADLETAFGADAPRRLDASSATPVPARFLRTSEFKAASKAPTRAMEVKSLAQVIPEWQEVYAYSDKRPLFRRVQKALHDSQPVLMVWNVDWDSRNQSDGTFKKLPASTAWDGAHMTTMEDYQVNNVPNYGTLPAGIVETNADKLNAALSNQAEVSFFRIKNSWGDTTDPSGQGALLKGYADLYADYLIGYSALTSFILPLAYDDKAPTGIVDACSLPAASTAGTYCVSGITKDTSDKRLVECAGGKTVRGQVCQTSCTVNAAGTADACVDSGGIPVPAPLNPCTKASSGVGKYCGVNLGIAAGAPGFSAVYSCQKDPSGAWISPATQCAAGCSPQPAGVPDKCN